MAPRGRRVRRGGLKREDAARDNMRDYGFDERIISETIKELIEVYGQDGWKLIEDGGYNVLLNSCLEKQEEQAKQVAEAQNEEVAEAQNDEVAEAQNDEVMNSSPPTFQSITESSNYAHDSVPGACGWQSEEEVRDTDADLEGDDDEIIQLTPEPLCEELQELVERILGQNKSKRKRPSRWDN